MAYGYLGLSLTSDPSRVKPKAPLTVDSPAAPTLKFVNSHSSLLIPCVTPKSQNNPAANRRLAPPQTLTQSSQLHIVCLFQGYGWPSHRREMGVSLGVGGETCLEPTIASFLTGYVLGIVCNALLYQAARSAGDLVV